MAIHVSIVSIILPLQQIAVMPFAIVAKEFCDAFLVSGPRKRKRSHFSPLAIIIPKVGLLNGKWSELYSLDVRNSRWRWASETWNIDNKSECATVTEDNMANTHMSHVQVSFDFRLVHCEKKTFTWWILVRALPCFSLWCLILFVFRCF